MSDLLDQLRHYGTVPVVTLEQGSSAEPLAEALVKGGLPLMEITLRTPAGLDGIRFAAKIPGMLLGAGTVLSADQVDQAAEAGAQFIVSPGLAEPVARRCRELNLMCFPGVVTPTEIMTALSWGCSTVKFFPADAFGGLKAMKAIAAPLPQVNFMPTGGINLSNLAEYLSFPRIIACGGTWMTKPEWVVGKRWHLVEEAVKETMDLVRSVHRSVPHS